MNFMTSLTVNKILIPLILTQFILELALPNRFRFKLGSNRFGFGILARFEPGLNRFRFRRPGLGSDRVNRFGFGGFAIFQGLNQVQTGLGLVSLHFFF